jgi:pSer/pThr/pTyr-binding forkhead associated (FHA) protein
MANTVKKYESAELMLVETSTGKTFPLVNGFRIGRVEGDLVLSNDIAVSSRHCIFHVSGPAVEIEDLGSRNGSFVNETKLEPKARVALLPGAKVRIGHTDFLIQHGNEKPKARETEIQLASLVSQLAPTTKAKPISWSKAPQVNKRTNAMVKKGHRG